MLSELPKVITVGIKIKCNKCLCAYYVTAPDLDARDTWGTKQTNVPGMETILEYLNFNRCGVDFGGRSLL